jgi:hypothetical protein
MMVKMPNVDIGWSSLRLPVPQDAKLFRRPKGPETGEQLDSVQSGDLSDELPRIPQHLRTDQRCASLGTGFLDDPRNRSFY